MMELKNYNPKTEEDWAIVAKYDSIEFSDEEYLPNIVEIDGQDTTVNELD